MERALKRVEAIKQANPLESDTMIGAQASSEQLEKILSYIDIGQQEGAELLTGAAGPSLAASWTAATMCSPPSSAATTHAHFPGRDLRTGGFCHDVQKRIGRAGNRQ